MNSCVHVIGPKVDHCAIYSMEETNYKAVAILCAIALTVFLVLSNDCRVCDIMRNPPDWIDTWYTGPDRWNTPEKGPTL